MQIISIINQKGGVAKSTTAHAVGMGLSIMGHRVLLVDLDAQGNLSYAMKATQGKKTAHELLMKQATARDAIQHTEQGDLIPSSPYLTGSDTLLTMLGKEYRLKEALGSIKNYDFIIIDTPPALGVLAINALTASRWAIVPAQADIFSLQGIAALYETIDMVRHYCNPQLEIMGILLTRHSPRTILSRDLTEIIEQTAQRLNTRLFKTTIREAVAVREAQASQRDLYSYAPRSTATADYTALVDEILERMGNNGA